MYTRMFLAFASILAIGTATRADDVADLKAEIEKLKQQVRALGEIIEGTAQPINLGRTSLATVTASSVNARRAMDNVYYGVVNAFDDGQNWHNNINYTYWLSSGEPAPWIEVRFDAPVVVTSIQVEQGNRYAARFTFAKGGDNTFASDGAELKLAKPLHGVKSVRLVFADSGLNGENTSVHEVRILGHAPANVEFKTGKPRVLVTAENARLSAQELFDEWRQKLLKDVECVISENDREITASFGQGLRVLFQVTVNKADGTIRTMPLAKLQ